MEAPMALKDAIEEMGESELRDLLRLIMKRLDVLAEAKFQEDLRNQCEFPFAEYITNT